MPPERDIGGEVVVTARRRGEAEVAAETEFSEDDIATQGADSIQDLVRRLAPFIGSGDQEPVLLINGRPADGDQSIGSYPAEALDHLAVLKPEAASRYGYAPGRRVVNLVLKSQYASRNVDAGASWATAGGQYGGTLSGGRVAISGDTRWNAQVRIDRQNALLKSARNIPQRPGIFDATGVVTAPDGGEVDPALSRAAGDVVISAVIPFEALSGPPTLADFAAASQRDALDPNDYETLQPSRSSISFNAGLTRPIGTFSASLNLNAGSSDSNGRRGLPMTSILLATGSVWSPFANDVVLSRPFAGDRALRADNSSKSLGASFTMSGRIGDWRMSATVNYARNWTRTLIESGIDHARLQSLTDQSSADFNPYGVLDKSLLVATRNQVQGDSLSARINTGTPILNLPAGPVSVNFSLEVNRNRSANRRTDSAADMLLVEERDREQANWRATVSVPLARRRRDVPVGGVGDVSIDVLLGGQAVTGNGVRQRYGAAVNWTPAPILRLRGGFERAGTAPTLDQLDGPIINNLVRVFDYGRQEIGDVISTTGGNPDLSRGSQRSLNVTARLTPFADETLALNVGYRQQITKGGVASFPELTPAIEAAFPERVTRDAQGRLVAIDARPITVAQDTSAELTSGLALRLRHRGKRNGDVKTRTRVSDPWQFSAALNHNWRLRSELLTRSGAPVIDRLVDGGSIRHTVTFQATAGKRGLGASLNGTWGSAYRVRGSPSGRNTLDIRFKPPLAFNLSAFLEPEHVFLSAANLLWVNHLRLSLDLQNMFKGYRRAYLNDGTIPVGYSRDEIDPLGRTIRLTVRKRF